ncbi:hypothetical protein [Vagococcus zengguangii]|uniref:Uncharacterized protein n=1 Tax=Vagococcus zengguangii TaxID=2571750 RepID=A0A4D7CTP9_9ENTE|nr:hypothetical protein [Vagococcus zengguangii]QCI86613.1 hypothetical protein FA707_06350 [Vagococcus zengguangii]
MHGEPQKVIAESEEDNQLLYMTQPILAQALMMSGEVDEAKLLLQKMAYQFMLNLYGNFEKLAVYEEDYQRFTYLKGITDSIIELFELRDFHPGVLLNGYADMALKFLEFKQADLALVELENYVSMIEQADYPIRLSGNHLFDLIDDWLQGLDEGKEMPVNEGVLANQLVALLKDPRLASDLAEETVYQQLITRLERWRATHVND